MSASPPRPIAQPANLKEIFRGEYGFIVADPSGPFIRYERNHIPFATLKELEDFMNGMATAIDKHGRAGRVILIDVRKSPGRNDPAFESSASRMRKRAYRGLLRQGVLVKSALGAMQVKRVAEEDGMERFVSTDEQAILRYLLEGTV